MAVQGCQRNRLADPAVGRRDGKGGAGHHRRRTITVGFAVVLARPDRMEAQPIGLGGKLDRLAIGPVVGLAELPMRLEAEGDAEFRRLHTNAFRMRPQSSIAFSWPGTSWIVNCV